MPLVDLLIKNMHGHGEQRYGVKVDIEFVVNLLLDEELRKPRKQVVNEFASILTQINSIWTQKIQGFMQEVLSNIEQDVRYNKIQLRNFKVKIF